MDANVGISNQRPVTLSRKFQQMANLPFTKILINSSSSGEYLNFDFKLKETENNVLYSDRIH